MESKALYVAKGTLAKVTRFLINKVDTTTAYVTIHYDCPYNCIAGDHSYSLNFKTGKIKHKGPRANKFFPAEILAMKMMMEDLIRGKYLIKEKLSFL